MEYMKRRLCQACLRFFVVLKNFNEKSLTAYDDYVRGKERWTFMLEKKEYKKTVKVCERIRRKYGVDAAWTNLNINLQRGSCSLVEYNMARMYMSQWSVRPKVQDGEDKAQ